MGFWMMMVLSWVSGWKRGLLSIDCSFTHTQVEIVVSHWESKSINRVGHTYISCDVSNRGCVICRPIYFLSTSFLALEGGRFRQDGCRMLSHSTLMLTCRSPGQLLYWSDLWPQSQLNQRPSFHPVLLVFSITRRNKSTNRSKAEIPTRGITTRYMRSQSLYKSQNGHGRPLGINWCLPLTTLSFFFFATLNNSHVPPGP